MPLSTKLMKINTMFSANAKPFIPGQQWMKPRRIKWHVRGITHAVHFDVNEGAHARKAGNNSRLIGRPLSPIAEKDRKAAQPFMIPEPEKTIEEQLEDLYDDYPMIIPNESRYIESLRYGVYGLGTPNINRIIPHRYNYCDN